jgi:AcrR family transcriptional regulator
MGKTEKKNAIADVAFELFLSNGYSTTKIIDIAKKAGIGKGTVYEYFESKESLLLYLIETRVSKEYREILDSIGAASGAEGKLRKYIEVEAQFIGKYGRYVEDMKTQFIEAGNEDAEKIMNAVLEIVRMQSEAVMEIVEAGIKEGVFRVVSPKMTATCISGFVGTYLTSATEECNEDEILNVILHGIGA